MSDVRPLEPYVVDLSESSNISHREDETEDLLPLTDQNLPVAGEDRGHVSRESEVEMEEGIGQHLGGEEKMADGECNPASLLSVQAEDTTEEHISNETNQMLETDALLLGVVNENAEEEDVEPGEESEEEEVDARESPQLEAPEVPGAGEADWDGDWDGEKVSEKGVEELEAEEGDGEEALEESKENEKEKEEVSEKETIAETLLEQDPGGGIITRLEQSEVEGKHCSLEGSSSGEEVAQETLGEQNVTQHISGGSRQEQHIPRSPPNVLHGDNLLVVEANQPTRADTLSPNGEEFGEGASNEAELLVNISTEEGRAVAEVENENEENLAGKGFVLESKVDELAKQLLMEMNMLKQERKEQTKEQVQDQEVKLVEEKEEQGEEEEVAKIVCESAESQNPAFEVGEDDKHMEQGQLKDDIKIDDAEESGEPKVMLKMVQLDDLIEARQAGGEFKEADEGEIIDCQAEDEEEVVNSSNVDDEIIDCLSEDEDMSELDSDDDDDSDVDIVEVTEDFPDDHGAFLEREPDCKVNFGCTVKKENSAESGKLPSSEGSRENKETKNQSKQDNNQEEGDSDIDTAAWHQRPQEGAASSTETEVERRNVIPGLRLVPWLEQPEDISAPKKTSTQMKKAKVAVEKLKKSLSKSVKCSTKEIMQGVRQKQGKKISKASEKEGKGLIVAEKKIASKPSVNNTKKLLLSETEKRVKKIKKTSKKLSTDTKSKVTKAARHVSKSKDNTTGERKAKSSKDTSLLGEDFEEGKKSRVKNKLSATFKIPRGNYQNQRMHTTGDNRVDSFLAEEQINLNLNLATFLKDEADFGAMFEAVKKLPTGKQDSKKKARELSKSESRLEMEDLTSEGWEMVRKLSCDKERIKKAQEEFGNPVPSDPFRNLTVHGFKGRRSKSTKKRRWCEANLPFCSHPEQESSSKRIRHEDFAKVMKTVFFHKFNKSRSSLTTASEEQVTETYFFLRYYTLRYRRTSRTSRRTYPTTRLLKRRLPTSYPITTPRLPF